MLLFGENDSAFSTVCGAGCTVPLEAQNPRLSQGFKNTSSFFMSHRRASRPRKGQDLACDHTVEQLEPDPRSSDFHSYERGLGQPGAVDRELPLNFRYGYSIHGQR